MGQHMAYSAISQEIVPPMPARVSAWAVYRVFELADGESVFIGITSDKHWERFCDVFGRDDLFADERLTTNNGRITEREWLLPELEQFFATMTKDEVVRRCNEAGIPFSPIARTEDLFDDPQLNEGDSLLDVELPDGRHTKLPRLPIRIDAYDLGLRLEAPQIGEHTYEVLLELGYTEEQIQSLVEAEIIATFA
jgi:crotonobetainyl-CoA:carnitine CoA-transferase CaiB-like acyl-CoA transferase